MHVLYPYNTTKDRIIHFFYDYLKVYIYSKMDNICIKYTLGRPYNELVMVL